MDDQFLLDLQADLENASSEQEALSALFGAFAAETARAIDADRQARQADAAIVDADPAAFPLTPAPTVVRVLRHACALTGYTPEELDDIFNVAAGTTQTLIDGGTPPGQYYYGDLHDFVNISRRVALTYPGKPVRDWWQTARHGKRLTPLELLQTRRQRKSIFAAYMAELDGSAAHASQLLPTLGSTSQWVELGAVTFAAP